MTLKASAHPHHPSEAAWTAVCGLDEVAPNSGLCVTAGGKEIAVLRVCRAGQEDRVYAISNYDPYARTFVMCRGTLGRVEDLVRVVSPLLKHTFDLASGQSLDHPGVALPIYPARLGEGRIWLHIG